jgi:hypothetical protein
VSDRLVNVASEKMLKYMRDRSGLSRRRRQSAPMIRLPDAHSPESI